MPACVNVWLYVAPTRDVVLAAQLVSLGEQNRPSGVQLLPLVTVWPPAAQFHCTVSPTPMTTVLGSNLSPPVPTVTTMVRPPPPLPAPPLEPPPLEPPPLELLLELLLVVPPELLVEVPGLPLDLLLLDEPASLEPPLGLLLEPHATQASGMRTIRLRKAIA